MNATTSPPDGTGVSLPALLAKAIQGPDCLVTRDGGAVLALSMHCLFVHAGFREVTPTKGSPYAPQNNWNCHPDTWVFRYTKSGLMNTITYTCALKQSTSQAYVHIEEDSNSQNVAFMGLILKKYVQDLDKLVQHTWDGVLSNEGDLKAYFRDYLLTPILSRAVKGDSRSKDPSTDSRMRLVQIAGGVVTAALVLVWASRQQKHQRRERTQYQPPT